MIALSVLLYWTNHTAEVLVESITLRPEPDETSGEALVAAREFHVVEAVVCGQVQVRRWIPGRPEEHRGLPSIEEPPGFDDHVGSKSITRGRAVPEPGRREAVDPCRNRITLR